MFTVVNTPPQSLQSQVQLREVKKQQVKQPQAQLCVCVRAHVLACTDMHSEGLSSLDWWTFLPVSNFLQSASSCLYLQLPPQGRGHQGRDVWLPSPSRTRSSAL